MSLIDHLANQLGWSAQQVRDYLSLAPNKYIPKRTYGHSVIAHPAKDLKKLQTAFLAHYADKLPVHDVVKAYKKKNQY